jgi:septal ring-binding cell division protein DamX
MPTTKIARTLGVTSLVILGLAACSNSPAPWTQTDDSPWSDKHNAEAASLPSDDVVDSTLKDPVLLADTEEPQAGMEMDVIEMYEPEPAPAPEVIAPVVVVEEAEPSTHDIMAMLSTNYAVQVFASKSPENVLKFQSRHDLMKLMTVKTNNNGSIIYVLVDVYPDRASAEAAAAKLEAKIGTKPWIRPLAGLQKIAVE